MEKKEDIKTVNIEAKGESEKKIDENTSLECRRKDKTEIENDETDNVIIETITETNDTKNGSDEANDEDAELLNEKGVLEEDKTEDDKESNKKEDIRHVRRSVRQRTQRFEIKPEEIGECDDKNDQDYK